MLRSLDYGAVREARKDGNWRAFGNLVVRAAKQLKRADARAIVLCSNSLHGAAHRVEAEVGLPVLHIGDALADAALDRGHRDLALFGTGFTMRRPFLRAHLEARGLTVRIPQSVDAIDEAILERLARGRVSEEDRRLFLRELRPLVAAGSTAMVLGCTEIPLLIQPDHVDVPLLDTLELHAAAAARWMLER